MKIKKAVITAAGQDPRKLPLQRVVDRDGGIKPVLQIIAEEARSAGAEDIAVVVAPGEEALFRDGLPGSLRFVVQPQLRGYGHAIWCAREFTGDEPFLHLVSDHLAVSRRPERCAQQLVAAAVAHGCAVSGVQATREHRLPHYGAIGGRRVAGATGLYEIEEVLEKPTPTEAEQRLIVPGLRTGHYLCFFGMHVLTPVVMEVLDAHVRRDGGNIQLSPALAELAARERYLALEVAGARYDIGEKYGLLTAQLALALAGHDRDEVLTQLVELLAKEPRS